MIKIHIDSNAQEREADIIRLAISAEINRLKLGLKKTNKQINKFEKKYNVSSDVFLEKLSAEDLEGRDQEYIEWAGELKLREKISIDLNHLEGIEYVTQ